MEDLHAALRDYVDVLIEKQKEIVTIWREYLEEVQTL